jgi:hypothetical protein
MRLTKETDRYEGLCPNWNVGKLERWNDGKMRNFIHLEMISTAFFTHYSDIPSFHYSLLHRKKRGQKKT